MKLGLAVALVGIIVLGAAYILQSDLVRRPEPRPNIFLADWRDSTSTETDILGFCRSRTLYVDFKLINVSPTDGIATVSLSIDGQVVDTNRYFVAARNTVDATMIHTVSCGAFIWNIYLVLLESA